MNPLLRAKVRLADHYLSQGKPDGSMADVMPDSDNYVHYLNWLSEHTGDYIDLFGNERAMGVYRSLVEFLLAGLEESLHLAAAIPDETERNAAVAELARHIPTAREAVERLKGYYEPTSIPELSQARLNQNHIVATATNVALGAISKAGYLRGDQADQLQEVQSAMGNPKTLTSRAIEIVRSVAVQLQQEKKRAAKEMNFDRTVELTTCLKATSVIEGAVRTVLAASDDEATKSAEQCVQGLAAEWLEILETELDQ